MRPSNDTLDSIIDGTFQIRSIVDVFYDEQRTFDGLPVTDWSFSEDLDSELKSTGDLVVTYSSGNGRSLSPRSFLDTLAPYGQQVNVLLECSVRGRSETIQWNKYRINKVPETSDSYLRFAGQTLVSGSRIKLTVDDLLSTVKRSGIRWPEPPAVTDSAWNEIQRLTGLPLAQSLDDKPTPTGLIYQPKEGGRLLAVQQLATVLGGIAVTNSFGELTVIPFEPPAATLELGAGKILTPPRSLDTEGLYNHVVGTFEEDDGTPIYAETWVRSGPLAAAGAYGFYTYYVQSDMVQTQSDADAYVAEVLQRLLSTQTYRVELTCRLNPLVEIGDVVRVVPLNGDPLTGRVVTHKINRKSAVMLVTLDVQRNVPAA